MQHRRLGASLIQDRENPSLVMGPKLLKAKSLVRWVLLPAKTKTEEAMTIMSIVGPRTHRLPTVLLVDPMVLEKMA